MSVSTDERQAIASKIAGFLSLHVRKSGLTEEDNIFESGFVNSLFAMQLVLFVEKEYDITVEDEDLEITNFQSIATITNFVCRKLCASTLDNHFSIEQQSDREGGH